MPGPVEQFELCSEDNGDMKESSELQTSEAGIDLKGSYERNCHLLYEGRTYSQQSWMWVQLAPTRSLNNSL